MIFSNIAGYLFVELKDYQNLRALFLEKCESLSLKGTILLSLEGINIGLCGLPENINAFKSFLYTDVRFKPMTFRESEFEPLSFKRLKIKLKKEIITLRQPKVDATKKRAPAIAPQQLKTWLDEGRDFTLLDTRNTYEVELGTFKNAQDLKIENFCDLPAVINTMADKIEKKKPLVMFCTGGVRCEKAALYLQDQGYDEVYQLDGGILNYFAEVGGSHYEGGCYVFDERVSVMPNTLAHSG